MKTRRCNELQCFANKRGLCQILTEAIRTDCPFLKTDRNITKGKFYPDNPELMGRSVWHDSP